MGGRSRVAVAAITRTSPPLTRLRQLIGRGLERTAELWPDIECAYGWVHRAAHILSNEAGEDATKVQRRFDGLVAAITRHRATAGSLARAIEHFGKVTRSYRPGLFHCYAVPDLPRTDNGLEQLFGSQRYHEPGHRPQTGLPGPCLARRGASDRGHGDPAAPAHRP